MEYTCTNFNSLWVIYAVYPQWSDKFREIKETSISGFWGFFFTFCFSELTSLTCSFQNVSYSRPISRNLMEGHCLLIKRSPGQYIIYLTFFFNKRRITITNNFYIWSISLLGYMYAEIYGNTNLYKLFFWYEDSRLSNNGKLSDTRVPEIWTFLLCFLHHLL